MICRRLLLALDRWCQAQLLAFAAEHGLHRDQDFNTSLAPTFEADRAFDAAQRQTTNTPLDAA